MQYLLKIIITASVVVAVSEIGKRSTLFAAILASLPMTSMLAILWLYKDTRDAALVGTLAKQIFWSVLPSLLFFLVFPVFLKQGVRFSISLLLSSVIMCG